MIRARFAEWLAENGDVVPRAEVLGEWLRRALAELPSRPSDPPRA